jgi:FkbM family methyltransferase
MILQCSFIPTLTDWKTLEIKCDTLDNILVDYRADVIKMDIEGAEVLALKAAKTLDVVLQFFLFFVWKGFCSINGKCML